VARRDARHGASPVPSGGFRAQAKKARTRRMRLGSLKEGGRDGTLVVVDQSGTKMARASVAAPAARTMQALLDDWAGLAPRLEALAADVERGRVDTSPVELARFASPLPRAHEWVDGSAYLHHVILVRKARGAEPPETLRTDPLVYQGGSSHLLGPRDDIPLADEAWGCDFESEVVVILGDVPGGTTATEALGHIRLVTMANDVSLRNLIPPELAKGFGFFQSKPATAFGPFAVTPDELGPRFREGRLYARMKTTLNGQVVGECETGPEMHFSFGELVAHVAKTRAFGAGTLLGSGTVSNEDRARGISCLAERRMLETIERGKPETPFLKVGDRVTIEVLDDDGRSLFGRIEQTVVRGRPRVGGEA
jgi:fumarylacetoacetate (FAA) hydrolase